MDEKKFNEAKTILYGIQEHINEIVNEFEFMESVSFDKSEMRGFEVIVWDKFSETQNNMEKVASILTYLGVL
jgi:hypothetical protein